MQNYDELDEILLNMRAEACAAELHGFLSGQLCALGQVNDVFLRDFLDVQLEDDELVDEYYREIQLLINELSENIHSMDFEFQLLLPDDDVDFADRIKALGEWCQGFLSSFSLCIEANSDSLSEQCKEVLEDLTTICRVGVDEDSNPDEEEALIEVIEFVRVSVMMIFEEINPGVTPGNNSGVLH